MSRISWAIQVFLMKQVSRKVNSKENSLLKLLSEKKMKKMKIQGVKITKIPLCLIKEMSLSLLTRNKQEVPCHCREVK
jgi:hypothetical protein